MTLCPFTGEASQGVRTRPALNVPGRGWHLGCGVAAVPQEPAFGVVVCDLKNLHRVFVRPAVEVVR